MLEIPEELARLAVEREQPNPSGASLARGEFAGHPNQSCLEPFGKGIFCFLHNFSKAVNVLSEEKATVVGLGHLQGLMDLCSLSVDQNTKLEP